MADPDAATGLSLREAQKQLTRRKLREAAREIFHEKGYPDTTVDEIVERAGASRGTFYIYFSSKNEVLTEIFVNEHVGPVIELIRELPNDPTPESLRAWLDRYLDLYDKHRKTIRTWIQAGSRETELRASSVSVLDGVLDVLDEWVRSYRTRVSLPANDEEVRTRSLLMFLQLQEFGYYLFIRSYGLNRGLGVAMMADQWQAALDGADPAAGR